MATLSKAAVLKDVAARLNVGILQIKAGRNLLDTVIDEEAYR